MKRLFNSCILAILFAVLIVIHFTVSDAKKSPAVSADTVSFAVRENPEAGLYGDVNIAFTQVRRKYIGTLYLPGGASASELMLSWENGISVSAGGTMYTGCAAPVPGNGQSLTYTVKAGRKRTDFTITTVQGSDSIESMFLNIDENLGTISDMNSDPAHETSCFGVLAFENETHDMSIKGRGNWTWGTVRDGEATDLRDKKPYNITIYKEPRNGTERFGIKDSVSLIEGVSAKKWTLLANYSDGTLLRNKIGFDLAKQLGIGLESRFVDVWMNGSYIGNYLLTPKNDYDAPKNGYLLELDNTEDAKAPYFSLKGLEPVQSLQNLITVKHLGSNAQKAGVTAADIQDWMQDMLDAVMDYSSEEYRKFIDVDSWAKMYLVQEFCKNYDVICGSILMRREGLTENDRLIAGPVWDLDNSLGRTQINRKIDMSSALQLSPDGRHIDGLNGVTSFLQYLGRHDDFMQRVYGIYNEYRDAFDGVLVNLDAQASLIGDSAAMNYSLYDINQLQYNVTFVQHSYDVGTGEYAYTQLVTDGYQDYLTNLRNFVSNRLKFFSDDFYEPAASG